MKKLLISLVRAYQLFISPLFPPSCRYYPSCSHYAIDAIKIHGPIKGSFLALRRVLRCHPGCEGGVDHAPEKQHKCKNEVKSSSINST